MANCEGVIVKYKAVYIRGSSDVGLSEKHQSVKEVEIDFDRLARLGNKINELLARKTRGSAEAYALLRFLCIYYEEDLGIAFQPEFEEKLRKVVKKRLEGGEPEPSESS